MAFTGSSLVIDEDTGYLSPGKNYSLTGFTAQKKAMLLQLFKESGNLGESALAVGTCRETVMQHLKMDPIFKRDFDGVVNECGDVLESVMFQRAKTPNGFMDRIAWLRAHRPDKYNPRTLIVHQSEKGNVDQILSSMKDDGRIIEIVESPPEPQPTQQAPTDGKT